MIKMMTTMVVVVMRNRVMMHKWRSGMILHHWWRYWQRGGLSTSSGAAFALQVSIAVWSDAAGICGRKDCLICAKFFHTASFSAWKQRPHCCCCSSWSTVLAKKKTNKTKHPSPSPKPFCDIFHCNSVAYSVAKFVIYVFFVLRFLSPQPISCTLHFPEMLSAAPITLTMALDLLQSAHVGWENRRWRTKTKTNSSFWGNCCASYPSMKHVITFADPLVINI